MRNQGFHYLFSRRLAFYLFLGLVLSDVVFFHLAGKPLGDSYSKAFLLLKDIDATLLKTMLSITAYILALIIPLIFLASVLMSHRISGPVFRFERSAESLANGDLTLRVRLREKDEMKDAAYMMDATIDKFRNQISGLKEKSRQIREDMYLLREASRQGMLTDDELAQLAEKIIKTNDELKSGLSHFKL